MGHLKPHQGKKRQKAGIKLTFNQDLFDSAYNYFPVTFRPPPNDPYGITAQDLKDLLQKCISANQHFAPFAFPALIDKLDSTSVNVKVCFVHRLIPL